MTKYGMVIDLTKCMGCRACMVACKIENGTPASHFWMYAFRFEEGVFPHTANRFLPRPCMHCEDPPCAEACPVDARIQWKDGIVATDADNCTGVRACESACPYGVNFFNVVEPTENQYLDWTKEEIAPTLGGATPPYWNPELQKLYEWNEDKKKGGRKIAGGGHRRGTVGKCTFCVHRIENGITETACQQVCPVEAIVFGDLDDPKSKISLLLEERGPESFRLKEEAGTNPKVYYLGIPPADDATPIEATPVADNVQAGGTPEFDGTTLPWK